MRLLLNTLNGTHAHEGVAAALRGDIDVLSATPPIVMSAMDQNFQVVMIGVGARAALRSCFF